MSCAHFVTTCGIAVGAFHRQMEDDTHLLGVKRFNSQSTTTGGKKAFNPGLLSPLVPVVATGTNKAGLKAPAFSPGCLRTGTNGPSRGPGHVLRLEDLWSRFVTRTGTKGLFGIKLYFLFRNFCIFFIFFISLLSNHLYSHISYLISN
jgi:hypothetical protein